MIKITLLIILLFLFQACESKLEKPNVTVGQYSKQITVMNGVVQKIMNESDPKIMHAMARNIEESRAVNCIPIKDECDNYYKLLNEIVKVTHEGKLTIEDKTNLNKLFNEFKISLISAEKKLQEDWKNYINSQPK